MSWPQIIKRLELNECVELHPKGNSMTPLIKSGQRVLLCPIPDGDPPVVGDIVLAKVHGNYYLHLITAVDEAKGRYQISNNHGHINGWASSIYGIVTEIGEDG